LPLWLSLWRRYTPQISLGSFGHRRFIDKEEVIVHLEEYLKQLKAEVTGVEEHVAELKKKQF
jgi:hypothetical protein